MIVESLQARLPARALPSTRSAGAMRKALGDLLVDVDEVTPLARAKKKTTHLC